MEFNDKTFQQAIEELRRQRSTFTSEEPLFKHALGVRAVIQQAIQDGRTIESVTRMYFPEEPMQEAVATIYLGVLLSNILDRALQEEQISRALHQELRRFIARLNNQGT